MAQVEKLSLIEAIEQYAFQTCLATSGIDPETLEIRFPNGQTGSIPEDFENVLAVNDIDYEGANNVVEYSTPPEVSFMLGLVVGAAMQRDGIVPPNLQAAIDRVLGASHG